MNEKIIYFQLNHYTIKETYPIEPFTTWDKEPYPYLVEKEYIMKNNKWCKDNNVNIVINAGCDEGFVFRVSATKYWLDKNFPELFIKYKDLICTRKNKSGDILDCYGMSFDKYNKDKCGFGRVMAPLFVYLHDKKETKDE